tara:strand:- start:482 stop:712 length:231 start_codon:yes stop_codon:yes gene_type:complete
MAREASLAQAFLYGYAKRFSVYQIPAYNWFNEILWNIFIFKHNLVISSTIKVNIELSQIILPRKKTGKHRAYNGNY